MTLDSLTEQIKRLADVNNSLLMWLQAHMGSATKHDLEEMEKRMAIKLSDLKAEVSAIRAQVGKIWGEQQNRYDKLLEKFTALEATLENAELDAETTAEVVAFKADLQAFDDTIPEVTG